MDIKLLPLIMITVLMLCGCEQTSSTSEDTKYSDSNFVLAGKSDLGNEMEATIRRLIPDQDRLLRDRFGNLFVFVDSVQEGSTTDRPVPKAGYWLQQDEMTIEAYDAMIEFASRETTNSLEGPISLPKSNQPRMHGPLFGSFNDLIDSIELVNSSLDDIQYRLPTYAEWTYACNSGVPDACDEESFRRESHRSQIQKRSNRNKLHFSNMTGMFAEFVAKPFEGTPKRKDQSIYGPGDAIVLGAAVYSEADGYPASQYSCCESRRMDVNDDEADLSGSFRLVAEPRFELIESDD